MYPIEFCRTTGKAAESRSLTLIAPSGFGGDHPPESERLYRAVTFPVWAQAFYDLLVSRPSIEYFLGKAFAGPVDRGLAEYAHVTSHRPGARNVPAAFVAGKLFTPDILDYYSALRQPVLAFCDASDYGPSELLPAFANDHGWTVHCIDGAKAMPHFEQRAATFRAMDEFFSTLGDARTVQSA